MARRRPLLSFQFQAQVSVHQSSPPVVICCQPRLLRQCSSIFTIDWPPFSIFKLKLQEFSTLSLMGDVRIYSEYNIIDLYFLV